MASVALARKPSHSWGVEDLWHGRIHHFTRTRNPLPTSSRCLAMSPQLSTNLLAIQILGRIDTWSNRVGVSHHNLRATGFDFAPLFFPRKRSFTGWPPAPPEAYAPEGLGAVNGAGAPKAILPQGASAPSSSAPCPPARISLPPVPS